MKLKIATAAIAATAALSVTGTASAWSFYVPLPSNQEKKAEQVNQTTVDKYRG